MSNEDKYFFKSITSADVMKLASKHDIAHLVALGLLNNNLADEEHSFSKSFSVQFIATKN